MSPRPAWLGVGMIAATLLVCAPSHAASPEPQPLVPELAAHPYRLDPGVRPFDHRLSVSPAFGMLGADRLFALRVTFNPRATYGYEASIGHVPGQSTHAVVHMLSVLARRPLPGRLQPYLTGGYGMVIVFPGPSLNADPVTKNGVTFGAGAELYLRSDLAVRAEVKRMTVFGRLGRNDGVVAFDYLQQTYGLSFYRSIKP